MKQTFSQHLKDMQISAIQNEQEFEKLDSSLFDEFNANLVTLDEHQHRWNEEYFNAKTVDLDFNFSKPLVEHLIAVKKQLASKSQVESAVENTLTFSTRENETKVNNEPVQGSLQVVKKEQYFEKMNLANFKPNQKLTQFLEEGDISKIRSYLMSMLNNRRLGLEELFKSIWYVNEHKASVFEAEEESAFVQAMDNNDAHWNIDYFSVQQGYLNKNFSLARLLHLANVRETLMKKGNADFQQIGTTKPVESIFQATRKDVGIENSESISSVNSTSHTTTQSHKVETEQNNRSHSEPKNEQKRESYSQPQQHRSEENDNGFVKIVMLVGGAVLTLAVALFVLF